MKMAAKSCFLIWVLLIGLTEAFVVPRTNPHQNSALRFFTRTNEQFAPRDFGIRYAASASTISATREADASSIPASNMSESVFEDMLAENAELFQRRDARREQLLAQRTKRLDQIVWTNAAIVGSLAFAALYQLLHVDVEAILALFEYGLGEHAGDLTATAVAFDLLARLPVDLVNSYQALVPTNPVFYKACTSGVAYGLGDFISQVYQGRDFSNIDLPRSMRSGIAGFIGHGPLCHYWLLFMETYLDFNGAWWGTGIKVTADLTVWAIFLNAAYSMIIGVLQFRNPLDVLKDVRATSWPALRSAWRFWPFVHTISFSHAVPLDLKLLWVDCMEVVWVTILSKVANEDKNQRLEETHDLNSVKDVDEDFGVSPPLEIELSREKEMDNLAFELPTRVIQACWPLIAMWPVLWAGYQVEVMLGFVHS